MVEDFAGTKDDGYLLQGWSDQKQSEGLSRRVQSEVGPQAPSSSGVKVQFRRWEDQ